MECASYGPISLLNLDTKMHAKILASRLSPLLPDLIGPDQVGFMPGRETKDNVVKALLLTQTVHAGNIEGLILSTDTEKAFDRVAWDYMLAVCAKVGLGPRMLARISVLYQCPTAKLKINGTLSDRVMITNCTRQGCQLSPLLFILSLEPFIRITRKNADILGFKVGDREYKVAAYAEDLLFFLNNPIISLPVLLKEFAIYVNISNLKVNYTKSEALNVSLPEHLLTQVKATSPFRL